jgi:hypothetical protein
LHSTISHLLINKNKNQFSDAKLAPLLNCAARQDVRADVNAPDSKMLSDHFMIKAVKNKS